MSIQLEYETPQRMTWRRVAAVLLLVVGVQFWLLLGGIYWGRNYQLWVVLGAVVAGLLPPVARGVAWGIDRIRGPGPRTRRITAMGIALAATGFFIAAAKIQGRILIPKSTDEHSYLLQIRMLASGRLWMEAHPLADFFESFALLVEPVYASMYFPGTALLLVPADWLGVPMWLAMALVAGACVGLMYSIVTELIDGAAGAAAALMLVSVGEFRKVSVILMSQAPMVLMALLTYWAWLRWRASRRLRWAAAMGIFGGWSAIIRPLDAVILVGPVAVMVLVELFQLPRRRALHSALAGIAGAAPLLALQIVFNVGVTGSIFETPFEYYAKRDLPGTTLGFHEYDPQLRPASVLPQKHEFYDAMAVPFIQEHQPDTAAAVWLERRLPGVLAMVTPHRLLMILMPLSLLALSDRARLAMWLGLPLFVLLYFFYTFFLPHYVVTAAPAAVLMIVLGVHALERAFPRRRDMIATMLYLLIAGLCISDWPGINRLVKDELFTPPSLERVEAALARVDEPAVVLFRYAPGGLAEYEPVYNVETPSPDDAMIIRAHDLGERNIEIFRYYAQRQPQRVFYRYDRETDEIHRLGTAVELAHTAQDAR